MLRTLWIIALIGSALGLIVLIVALFGFSDNSMHLAAAILILALWGKVGTGLARDAGVGQLPGRRQQDMSPVDLHQSEHRYREEAEHRVPSRR